MNNISFYHCILKLYLYVAVCDSTQQYRPKNILQEPKLIFIDDNEMHISAV